MLISAILGGTAFVGIFVVADEFVLQWIGSDWTIAQPFAFLLGLELYTLSIRTALGKYRTTMGLFQQAKYRPLAGMLINIVLSVLLVQKLGISGVIIGTIAMDWLTLMWYDPIIIHKFGFNHTELVSQYFKKFMLYFISTVIIGAFDYFICSHVFVGYGWVSIILHAIICALSVPVALIVVSYRTAEGVFVRKLVKNEFVLLLNKLRKRH